MNINRFYCEVASNISTHLICPVGHYCPEGSGVPSPCPAGTYTNTQGLTDVLNCTDCDPGKFCNDTGLCLICIYLYVMYKLYIRLLVRGQLSPPKTFEFNTL